MNKIEKPKTRKRVEGAYSHLLPQPEVQYDVGLYYETGDPEKGTLVEGIASVVGREYDTSEKLRRSYLVNRLGEIFEITEYDLYPFEDESRKISRTVYKDGSGRLLGVEAHIKYKNDGGWETFWEWRFGRKEPWDHTKLENESSMNKLGSSEVESL